VPTQAQGMHQNVPITPITINKTSVEK
jgi:hypothetical protein